MKLVDLYWGILIIILLSGISGAISISYTSSDSNGESSVSADYNLDRSTSLSESTALGSGSISSSSFLEGNGINAISKTVGSGDTNLQSRIASTGDLSARMSNYASGDLVNLGQSFYSTGMSEGTVSGAVGSASATQSAGVLDGTLASSQSISAQDLGISGLQSTELFGALGHSDGGAQLSNNKVEVSAGLNGIGTLSTEMSASALDSAIASSSVQADSLFSKAYSAGRATSAEADAYSYLSSGDQLNSAADVIADEQVSTNQNLQSAGDVLVFTSARDSSSTMSFTGEGSAASGSLSTNAGNLPTIENNLAGDLQSKANQQAPQAGNLVWQSNGGYITSNPSLIIDYQYRSHAFVAGGDHGLWDNMDGDWYGLGGYITSDPYAVEDKEGRIHVLARGSDNGLWDNIIDTPTLNYDWHGLGGIITSDPAAVLEPNINQNLIIFARGSDNALWFRNLETGSLSGSWQPDGGYITSNPYPIYDNQGNIHVFARGGDNALWDLKDTYQGNGLYVPEWHSLGGIITSDAKPIINPVNYNEIVAFTRGGNGGLWARVLDTQSMAGGWSTGGGYISPAGSGSPIYQGNPEPIVTPIGNVANFVRGGDGSLWVSESIYNPASMNWQYEWYPLGGYITSDPSAITDGYGIFVLARGGDGALWNPVST
jgi:hypothetical protein